MSKVRKYRGNDKTLNGCYYITVEDARSIYNKGPKRAAAQELAAKAKITVRAAYSRIVREEYGRNGEGYFLI